jgi:hypothetical protein
MLCNPSVFSAITTFSLYCSPLLCYLSHNYAMSIVNAYALLPIYVLYISAIMAFALLCAHLSYYLIYSFTTVSILHTSALLLIYVRSTHLHLSIFPLITASPALLFVHLSATKCLTAHSTHCKENPNYVFSEKELRVLSLNIHIHVSVSELYIHTIGLQILLQENMQTNRVNI